MDNSLAAHLPILVQAGIGAAFPVAVLAVGHVFRKRRHAANAAAAAPEDSTAEPPADVALRADENILRTALLVALFAAAFLFLLLLALVLRDLAAARTAIFAPASFLLAVFTLGLFYELRTNTAQQNAAEKI